MEPVGGRRRTLMETPCTLTLDDNDKQGGAHILGANRLQIDRLGGRIFKLRSGERSCMKDKISNWYGYISTLIDLPMLSIYHRKSCC